MSEGRFRYQAESAATKGDDDSRDSTHQSTYHEEFHVSGKDLTSKVARLLREGNVLSITVKDQFGNVYFEIPMAVGVIGTILFPSVAALGVIGAVASNLKIVVERRDKVPYQQNKEQKRTIRRPRDEQEQENH